LQLFGLDRIGIALGDVYWAGARPTGSNRRSGPAEWSRAGGRRGMRHPVTS